MSNAHDEIPDSTAQEEPALAGFSSAPSGERRKKDGGRKDPPLGELLTAAETATTRIPPTISDTEIDDTSAEEPAVSAGFGPLDAVPPLAGSPITEPAADTAASVEDVVQLLRREIAAAWGEDDVDNDAFAKVSHLTIVQAASDNGPLIVADPAADDEVMLGTREDGVQAVLGNSGITAAQALSRAQIAMTSTRFRTEGVEEVHGTEMDKALLMLAAESVGLNIVNKPEVSAAVMAQAKAQWDALTAAATPAAEVVEEAAPVAANAAVQDGIEELEIAEPTAEEIPVLTDIVHTEKPATTVSLKPEVQEILAGSGIAPESYVDLRERLKSGQDKTLADDQGFVLTDAFREQVLKALEADGVTYNAECITHEPRTVINHQVASTKTSADVATAASLKPEVLEILNGANADDNIAAETYLDLRSRLKSGQDKTLADDQGFILKDSFREHGGSEDRTQRLLKALEADGVTYNAERITTAPRTVINYQVKARAGLRAE